MAWSHVAAGAAASGVNATSLTPGLTAGWAENAAHVLQVQTWGGTSGREPQVPAGWTELATWGGPNNAWHMVCWRLAQSGDTDPTVTMDGTGAANDSQVARIHGFRTDVSGEVPALSVVATPQTNTGSDSVSVLGLTIGTDELFVVSVGKSNDFNGDGAVAGMTQSAVTNETTGNDCGASLLYALAPSPGATGNFGVTDNGGTASNGVGRGLAFTFTTTPGGGGGDRPFRPWMLQSH